MPRRCNFPTRSILVIVWNYAWRLWCVWISYVLSLLRWGWSEKLRAEAVASTRVVCLLASLNRPLLADNFGCHASAPPFSFTSPADAGLPDFSGTKPPG